MGEQAVERREVMQLLAVAAAAGTFPGFERWAFGFAHTHGAAAQTARGAYQPRFFSSEEYSLVERLAELIIPSDGAPGAREAGAGEFIDFMVAHDTGVQARFRFGLTWLDAHSRRLHGRAFAQLGTDQQNEILERLAYKERHRRGEEEGQAFFRLIRDYTVMGFFTSRAGMEYLDMPGLKVYSELPGCPHADDPGHEQLPPATI